MSQIHCPSWTRAKCIPTGSSSGSCTKTRRKIRIVLHLSSFTTKAIPPHTTLSHGSAFYTTGTSATNHGGKPWFCILVLTSEAILRNLQLGRWDQETMKSKRTTGECSRNVETLRRKKPIHWNNREGPGTWKMERLKEDEWDDVQVREFDIMGELTRIQMEGALKCQSGQRSVEMELQSCRVAVFSELWTWSDMK